MGATFSRIKNWAPETLTNTDLNAEIDNILTYFVPSGMDDYSTNTAQMRLTTDPGEVGSESLATSLAGEIERLRFEIKAIKGDVAQWYTGSNTSLSDLRSIIGGGAPDNRISSGLTSLASSQMNAIIPTGISAGLKVEGTPTNFIYFVNGIQYTLAADLNVTGLVLAPGSNNTTLVNDPDAGGGSHTRVTGMHNTVLSVDAMGTEISTLIGKTAGFKIYNGVTTEYFTAYIESSTKLTKCRRGYFYDSSGVRINSITFSDNAVITLMKLTYIFLSTTGTAAVSYTMPTYSALAPTSPAVGDYWYDMTLNTWKRFDSVTWNVTDSILIGMSLQDATNCVAARTMDSFTNFSNINTLDLERTSNSGVTVKNYGAQTSVFGNELQFQTFRPVWDMSINLDSGVTEAATTTYYFYLDEAGKPIISDMAPIDRKGDLLGYYHPTEAWRCFGKCDNDGSSNLTAVSLVAFSRTREVSFFSNDVLDAGSIMNSFSLTAPAGWRLLNGASSISRWYYNELFEGSPLAIGTAWGTADANHFNLPDPRGKFLRYTDSGATNDPDSASRVASATGGNTADNVGSGQDSQFADHGHGFISCTTTGGSVSMSTTNHFGANSAGAGAMFTVTAANVTNTAMILHSGGNETRPINFNANMVMKVLR